MISAGEWVRPKSSTSAAVDRQQGDGIEWMPKEMVSLNTTSAASKEKSLLRGDWVHILKNKDQKLTIMEQGRWLHVNLELLIQYFLLFTECLLNQKGVNHCVYTDKKEMTQKCSSEKGCIQVKDQFAIKGKKFDKEQGRDWSGVATIQSSARHCAVACSKADCFVQWGDRWITVLHLITCSPKWLWSREQCNSDEADLLYTATIKDSASENSFTKKRKQSKNKTDYLSTKVNGSEDHQLIYK